jgi:hypothetical protein
LQLIIIIIITITIIIIITVFTGMERQKTKISTPPPLTRIDFQQYSK